MQTQPFSRIDSPGLTRRGAQGGFLRLARRIAMTSVMALGVTVGGVACQATDSAEVVFSVQQAAREVETLAASPDVTDQALQERSRAVSSRVQSLTSGLRVPLIEVKSGDVLTAPLVADRIHVSLVSRLGDPSFTPETAVLALPEVVTTDLMEFAITSEDCVREPAVVVEVDPTKVTVFDIGSISATCTDQYGSRPAKGVSFQKRGRPGLGVEAAAANGPEGARVGIQPPDASSGASCGDAGVNGTSASDTPGASSAGGDGAAGQDGGRGGDVAFTLFQLTVGTNTAVSFEAPGGDGGPGQVGGNGGVGGLGQDGGDASDGREACCYGTCDASGCNLETVKPAGVGGVGGAGGPGGLGGNGGDGGLGGNGGNGGLVIMLVEVASSPLVTVPTVLGGDGGKGGNAGAAGAGGYGGRGGLGGYGGVNCQFVRGDKANDGSNGAYGAAGSSGVSGAGGKPGTQGFGRIIPTGTGA